MEKVATMDARRPQPGWSNQDEKAYIAICQEALRITPEVKSEFIDFLKDLKVEVLVAPFEADGPYGPHRSM